MKIQSGRRSKLAFYIILSLVLAAAFVLLVLGLVSAQSSESLVRITTASDSNRDSSHPSLSVNGTIIAFSSDSDFLGQGIPDEQNEIWLYDTTTMTYTRITTASDSDRDSSYPYLSADGTTIAFLSDSDFLGQSIPDEQDEVWLYDTATLTYTRITTASDSNRDSWASSLSDDGTVIAFFSDSDILGQGIPDEQNEIWLYDTTTLTYTRITTASDGNRDSWWPKLSADGTVVVFHSNSDFLGQGIPDGQQEVWLYDTKTMTYTRVTTASGSGRYSSEPRTNADGTIVVFYSDSDFLSEGIPQGQKEIWLYDTTTLTLTRVTTASDSNRQSYSGGLSPDGTIVAFASDSDFLGQGIPDNQFEVWLYDTTTLTYTRITTASDNNRVSSRVRLSPDGTVVAFVSDSDYLSQGIPDDQNEIWLKRIRYRVYLPLVLR